MAKLYGLTVSDPVEAPAGIVSVSGSPVVLPEGFTLPSGKSAAIAGSLNVTGATTLASLTVSGATSFATLSIASLTFSGNSSTALDAYISGTFTGTVSGLSSPLTVPVRYVRIGRLVHLSASDGFSGTSNSTALTISGLPAAISPVSTKYMSNINVDNGTNVSGRMDVSPGGVLTFFVSPAGGVFSGSGTKGVLSLSGSYTLD